MASLLTVGNSRRELITPPKRNPITLDGVSTPDFKNSKKAPTELPFSSDKKEGIKKGEFSEQGRRSFSLAYENPEPLSISKKIVSPAPYEIKSFSHSKRKALCTPTSRNPIIEGEIAITPIKVRSKITESSVFKNDEKKVKFKPIFTKKSL